ncbi:helix-turn-helix domain-containing protein [Nesterenkonia aerolata]|uniref:Helix-turn-helix transcriptional regulator n=1 Tax=Nesterenkonia aerolata TaxID=3074079 RepID=A0ABU2DQ19_9MICC|nr:helix-turn-helix transcriptional regulator [Nesterenkonia sp. LY-0111]MDR8018554.1 helix-turn-helix transcriptional regulator [Nesterenkonia sp. LY-0111]
MRLSDLKSHDEVVRERRAVDPAYAAEADRLRLAGAVSVVVVRHRAEQGLSQTGLAKVLGWTQARVARLERGDVIPSMRTLEPLARAGILEVHLTRDGAAVEQLVECKRSDRGPSPIS